MALMIALAPALFWGLMPLAVSKIGGTPLQQVLGTTAGTLIFASVVALISPPSLTWPIFWYGFASGACWAFAQLLQFKSFTQIGVSNAMPISTGMQLVGTALMGVIAFGEWGSVYAKLMGFVAILFIIAGIYLTTKKEKGSADSASNVKAGLITLLIATIGYVGYSFFPRLGNVSGQDAFLAQGIGMVSMSLLMAFFVRGGNPLSLKSLQNIGGGLLFAVAALSYLISAEMNGVATGFTLSQMNVVVATLGSIFVLGEKKTKKEMWFVMGGLTLVVIGGVMIGLIPK